jgi:GNAT superfamily N-acetyltransferase
LAAIIETYSHDPDTAARDALYDLLGADNTRKSGLADRGSFAILIKAEPDGQAVGGLWGADDCGWAFIDLLYIPDHLQGQGLGTRLVEEAESIARRQGLMGIWTNTYDFQAGGFYAKLGFVEFGRLEGGRDVAGQLFLKKRF